MIIFETVLNYLTQSSTYKGLFTILGALGVTLSDGLIQAIIACALGVFGLIDVIADEKSKKV